MITAFELINAGKPHPKDFDWVHKVAFLKDNKRIDFKPGLNIVFGPNGTGKSTLVDLCASLLFARQGGRSVVTRSGIEALLGWLGKEEPPARIEHDGQPVMYINPRNEIGLRHGHFDDDFMADAFKSMEERHFSQGERTSSRIDHVVRMIMKQDVQPASRKGNARRKPVRRPRLVVDGWPSAIDWNFQPWKDEERMEKVREMLKPTISQGQKTLLMDEPETGFSLVWQAGFWNQVMASKEASEYQIIVATHSPFAMDIPHANYIETVPGYLQTCRDLMKTEFAAVGQT